MTSGAFNINTWAREDILEEQIEKLETQIDLLARQRYSLLFENARYDFLIGVNKNYGDKVKELERTDREKVIAHVEKELSELTSTVAKYKAEKRRIYVNSY